MKCVPMIFNGEMIKALAEGRKTVTRRVMKPQPTDSGRGYMQWPSDVHQTMINIDRLNAGGFWDGIASEVCPLSSVGDLLWVRETWGVVSHSFNEDGNMVEWTLDRPALPVRDLKYGKGYHTGSVIYRADGEMRWCNDFEEEISAWKPSIHMPRWASRFTLKVTDVRIERVKEITPQGAKDEGFNDWTGFAFTWSSIYLDRGLGWDDNPYVWVIEFELIRENIDKHIAKLNKSIKVPVYTGVKDVDTDHYRFISEPFDVEPTKITRQKIRGRGDKYAYTAHFIGREPMIGVDKKSLAGRESKETISEGYNPGWVPPKDGWIDDVWMPSK